MNPPARGTFATDAHGRRSITFERYFDTTIDDLWQALTDPHRLADWLAPATVAPGLGGHIALHFDADDAAQQVTGTILTWQPPRVLEYAWHFPGEAESVVRWELHEHGAGTRLVLVHRTLGSQYASGYGAGWHAYLDQLAAVLAGQALDWQVRFDEVHSTYQMENT